MRILSVALCVRFMQSSPQNTAKRRSLIYGLLADAFFRQSTDACCLSVRASAITIISELARSVSAARQRLWPVRRPACVWIVPGNRLRNRGTRTTGGSNEDFRVLVSLNQLFDRDF